VGRVMVRRSDWSVVSFFILSSGGLRQLHEVDGLGVLGRPVVECLGREETGLLGKVAGIPEDVR